MPDRAVRRRVLSQNFLVDRRAIDALVHGSGAGRGDLVVDIGAGNGLISEALARRGAQVLAIERDPALARRLRAKFATWPTVSVLEDDVLTAPLPASPFRVVANIPFGITTKILRRLLDDDGLLRADLIVQAEVARKRGTRGRGTLLNACWEPWFEFGTGARIPATAFRPVPRVDTAVLIVTRRDPPLLDPAARRDYTDFVTAAFEGARPTVASALPRAIPRARFAGLARELGFAAGALPSELGADQWAGLFLAAGPARGGASRASPSHNGPPRADPSRDGAGAGPGRGRRGQAELSGQVELSGLGGPRRSRRRVGDRPVP